MARSSLRKFSACRCSVEVKGIWLILVTPSTMAATSSPKNFRRVSTSVMVSSTTSWSSPTETEITSSPMSARIWATSSGWVRYGSPFLRNWLECSRAEKT